MKDYQQYINALRKCAKEHENDRTSTGHIIVSCLCGDTADLLEALEQEPILDKIRAEISNYGSIWVRYKIIGHTDQDIKDIVENVLKQAKEQVLDIIDKYRESEGE